MTLIVRKEDVQKFTADDVIWSKDELVKAIVRQVLVGQTEVFVEMTVDCQHDYDKEDLSREGLQSALGGVKENAGVFLADVMHDLQHAVTKQLEAAQYGAIVTGIKYDLSGEITDIEVDVTVS